MGRTGRGTWEHHGVGGRVDLITTTFGKALGGALGGCTAGPREVIGLLRQRSRPYLFSNSLAPAVVGATLRALELLTASTELRDRLEANTKAFRERMTAAGFEIKPGVHPIVPIMFSRFAPDDAPARPALRAGAARRGGLREGLLLPGGGEGPLAHPGAALGRAPPGAHRPGGRGVHEGGAGARRAGPERRPRARGRACSVVIGSPPGAEPRAPPPAGRGRGRPRGSRPRRGRGRPRRARGPGPTSASPRCSESRRSRPNSATAAAKRRLSEAPGRLAVADGHAQQAARLAVGLLVAELHGQELIASPPPRLGAARLPGSGGARPPAGRSRRRRARSRRARSPCGRRRSRRRPCGRRRSPRRAAGGSRSRRSR